MSRGRRERAAVPLHAKRAAAWRLARAIVFFLLFAACGRAGGGYAGLPGKGLGSDAEIAFYAASPAAAFEKYFALWKSGESNLCDINAKMMTCTAALSGGAPDDERRIAATGLSAEDILRRSYAALEGQCATDAESRSEGARSYAVYYRRVHRVGLGLPYAAKAVDLTNDGTYEKMASLAVLADVYDAMGWFEQRDDTRWKAIETGRAYFKFDASKRAPTLKIKDVYAAATAAQDGRFGAAEGFVARDQIRLWDTALQKALEELSFSHDAGRTEKMRGAWADLALICPIDIECSLVPKQYPNAARRFARAGDLPFAQKLYDDALAAASEWVTAKGMYNFDAAAAALAAANGNKDHAADAYEKWMASVESLLQGAQRTGVEPLGADDYAEVGLAEEAAGRMDKAIEHFEKGVQLSEANRSSFDVQARLRFLRGRTIHAYWGLVRSYATRYLAGHDVADLERALRSASMLNARQFGEVLGIDESKAALSAGRLGLRAGELVVLVVQTDLAIVSFGLTSDWRGAHVFRGDMADVGARIRKVKAAISRPGGADGVKNDLAAIGAAVFSDFRDRLTRVKSLTVVCDGSIGALPFGLFPESDSGGAPLVISRSVTYAPSLPYLASRRSASSAAFGTQTLAVGDPKYGPLPAASKDPQTRGELNRAVRSMKLVVPLPETRAEATRVFQILGGKGALLLGANATESRIKNLPLADFGFIHLATHGVLGNQLPGVHEPALLFAAEDGQDAFLTMSEVQALKLRAKLTVLSACDTGSGEYFEGEGVMGLSRAFLLAGSQAVVATLWPIASESTVDFMKRFYARLARGSGAAEALRETQVDFLTLTTAGGGAKRSLSLDTGETVTPSLGFRDAYFWAPFVLLGGG
jgi:CHAT domain-containing protein/tetratricopeptide (TPR) repeat protein